MKKVIMATVVLALFACALIYIVNTSQAQQQPKIDKDMKTCAQSSNSFAVDLYQVLSASEGNIFLSPSSISTALAMTSAGARGETADEMKKTLHFKLEDKKLHPAIGRLEELLVSKNKAYKLSIANALWGQKEFGFSENFLKELKNSYEAGLNEVDFKTAAEAARKEINAWVEKNTNNKIKDLIKPGILNALTRLVLTNAIHFKGTWKTQFKKNDTKKADFHLSPAKKIKSDMMHMTKKKFKYYRGDDFQAVQLPYSGENISMVVFLPDKVDGLKGFEKKLNAKNLDKWISGMSEKKLDMLAMPRFKMTCEFSLNDALKELGMVAAFDPAKADFSAMTGKSNGLYITAVVHKAFVDVNEEGTEAAAATAVVVGLRAVARPTIFRADHPFFFVIRDNRTGAILFMGRVLKP